MKTLQDLIKYLNNRTLRIKNKYGQDIFVSIFFEKQGQERKLLDHIPRSQIGLLRELAQNNPYDKIRILIHEPENDHNIYFYDGQIHTDEDLEKLLLLSASSAPPNGTMMPVMPNMQHQEHFNGFGQAEVENIVSKRLAEEKTRMELIDLRERVNKKDEKISNLKQNIKELETKLEVAAKEQDELESKIKLKESIRYYADFAGDVLEGFGLDKNKLRQPLAGLLLEEEEQNREQAGKQIEKPESEDESGIVEEGTQNPNETVIAMINEFLKKTDNETLALIYEILVYIEKDNNTARHLYNHLIQNSKTE